MTENRLEIVTFIIDLSYIPYDPFDSNDRKLSISKTKIPAQKYQEEIRGIV